jgi:hypothetical protein
MKTVSLTKRKQAQLLGILFAEYQILTTEQASIIRQLMDKPKQVFEDSNSLWAFYNHVTTALQFSHPRTWMEDQRILHFFISTVTNFQQCTAPAQVVETVDTVDEAVVDPLTAIPNQTNILDQIAEMEANQEADIIDEDIRYAEDEEDILVPVEYITPEEAVERYADDVIQYTDPVGNTFEAPLVEEVVVETAPQRVKFAVDNTEEDQLDLDFNDNTSVDEDEDPDDLPDFF